MLRDRATTVRSSQPDGAANAQSGAACAVFALLDDSSGQDAHTPCSRLYTGFVREHVCTDPAELTHVWARMQSDQQEGLHAVLLADYEWGVRLAGPEGLSKTEASDASLRLLMFARCEPLSRSETERWLRQQDPSQGETPSVAGHLACHAQVDEAEFKQAVRDIQEAIRLGQVYQINYTYALQGQVYGSPVALYRRLRARQPVAFGALMALPPRPDRPSGGGEAIRYILSLSPELFVRHTNGRLTARPMKGTSAREHAFLGDEQAIDALKADPKCRAENLMIVDLLRNDLGRIACIGSVEVPELFAVETYETVFQMTSTIQANLTPGASSLDVFKALFPCGSITGAPKHQAMRWIDKLERTRRGAYCGAVGWVDAPRRYAAAEASAPHAPVLGDFCLSVAIRTLQLGPASQAGVFPFTLGVGAGIVLDSDPSQELNECRLKARFFTGMNPGFDLLETCRYEPGMGIVLWAAHKARLQRSAQALGFVWDEARIESALAHAVCGLPAEGPSRVRVVLSHGGSCQVSTAPLPALHAQGPDGHVRVCWAAERLPQPRPLAPFKTTARAQYDEAVQQAQAMGAFDALWLDTEGQLLEGGRTSVFVRQRGRWWTPPLAAGVLPGVMRAKILADPAWQAAEKPLSWADVVNSEALMVCNALRGPLSARLIDAGERFSL